MSAVNDAHAAVPSGDLGGLHQVTGGSNQDANTSDEDADSEGSEMADDSEDDCQFLSIQKVTDRADVQMSKNANARSRRTNVYYRHWVYLPLLVAVAVRL